MKFESIAQSVSQTVQKIEETNNGHSRAGLFQHEVNKSDANREALAVLFPRGASLNIGESKKINNCSLQCERNML